MNKLDGLKKQIGLCIETAYKKGYDDAKEKNQIMLMQGMEKAWEYARKIVYYRTKQEFYEYMGADSCLEIFANYSIIDVINKMNEYENSFRLKVGDIIVYKTSNPAVITKIDESVIEAVDSEGSCYCYDNNIENRRYIRKTDKSFPQVTEMFKQLEECGKEQLRNE